MNQYILLPAALDDRLTHAKLVNAVADRLEGLIHRVFPERAQLALMEGKQKFPPSRVRPGTHQDKIGEFAFEQIPHPVAVCRRDLEADLISLVSFQLTRRERFFSEEFAHILFDPLQSILHRLIYLHLQNQMAPPLKIQSQMNPLRREKSAPPGRDLAYESRNEIKSRGEGQCGKDNQSNYNTPLHTIAP